MLCILTKRRLQNTRKICLIKRSIYGLRHMSWGENYHYTSKIHCNYIFIVSLITTKRNHRMMWCLLWSSLRVEVGIHLIFRSYFGFSTGGCFVVLGTLIKWLQTTLIKFCTARYSHNLNLSGFLFVILDNIRGLYKSNHKLHFPRCTGSWWFHYLPSRLFSSQDLLSKINKMQKEIYLTHKRAYLYAGL